jgi:DNA-binding CsgD family transcriptional regulator
VPARLGSVTTVSEPLWRGRREAFFYLLPVGCILAFYAVVMIVGPEHPADEGGLADFIVGLALAGALVYRRHPLTIMLAVLAASVVVLACRPWEPSTNVITGGILLTAVPALLGLYIGVHRRLVQELTERETEVLGCLGEGMSNAQIAARLSLAEATVKGYVSRMLIKLGCANRTQAGLLAYGAGLVTR